jgi:putative hydrolase of the HAD superfamily
MTQANWLNLISSRRQTGPIIAPDGAEPQLHKLEGIRAIVFDVYGTLFSSGVGDISLATVEDRDAALRATLAANKICITELAAKIRLDEQLHRVIESHQNKRRAEGIEYPEVDIRLVWSDLIHQFEALNFIEPTEQVCIETLAIDYESRVNPTQPMPDLEHVLRETVSRGLALSIISNAQFYTPLLFEAYLGQSIEQIGFSPEANVWSFAELEGKPSQRLYTRAAERLREHHGRTPGQCLYVGNDMRNDIWPAQEVGFKTALFAGDHLSLRRRKDHPACIDLKADAEITSLAQILTII